MFTTNNNYSYVPSTGLYLPRVSREFEELKEKEQSLINNPTQELAYNNMWLGEIIENFDYGLNQYHSRGDILTKKGFAEAERAEKDPQIQACLKLLKLSTLLLDIDVQPANDSKEAIELAEFTKFMLSDKNMNGTLTQSMYRVCSALFYGYSISEKKLEYIEEGKYKGFLTIKELKTKKPGHYGFKISPYDEILAIRNLYTYELLPKDKFFIYSYMDDWGNPHGSPLFDVIYPYWYAKKELMRLMILSLAKFATPTAEVILKNGNKSDELKKQADDILKKLQTVSGIRHTEDLEVKLLEATKMTQNPYLTALNWLNGELAKAILSSVLATNEGTNGTGSYAQSKVHHAVTEVLVEYLSKTLGDAVYQQMVIPMLKWNFNNQKYPIDIYPNVSFSSTKQLDIKAFVDSIKILHDLGYIDNDEVDTDWIRDSVKAPQKEFEENHEEEEMNEDDINEAIENETEDPNEKKFLKRMFNILFKKQFFVRSKNSDIIDYSDIA